MGQLNQAYVTPALIAWARTRHDLSMEEVAQKIHVRPDQIYDWERGHAFPTMRQAREFARRLYIPFGYLFLSSPPEERTSLPDLRTVSGAKPTTLSPGFLDLINDVLRKHEWYRDYAEKQGGTRLKFVGRFKPQGDANIVADDIGEILLIDESVRQESVSWEDFLGRIRDRAEAVGVLVLRSGIVGSNTRRKLSVQEFRGFAISDSIAPLIFINGADAKAAQIFTIAHELAHLWIGATGISRPDFTQQSMVTNRTELFCNNVAAQVLVPRDDFLDRWATRHSINDNVYNLVRHYRVSSWVILRRAYDLKKISWADYTTHYKMEVAKQRTSIGKGGGDFYNTLQSRNGKNLLRAVVSAAFEERILFRDAARLLNVKVDNLGKIAERVGLR